jgi:F-type H+-transporting ATPase subunit b
VGDNPLIQPDPGLFVWTILTFLVLAALLAKFAWRPMLQALDRRRQMVENAVVEARRAKEELERAQQENARILASARVEAESIVSRSRADAERLRAEMREKATADAAALLRNAERQIQLETSRAIEQIRHEAIDLSIDVASKLLRRNVSKQDNDALIANAIEEIGTGKH